MTNMNVVIFSKDRAPQLDLLLRSMERNFYQGYNQNVTVIFKASSKEYENGYRALIKLYGRKEKQTGYVTWVNEEQTSFKEAAINAIDIQKTMTMFLVDDIVFTNSFTVHDDEFAFFNKNPNILGLSLRLDPKKTYCYAIDKSMTVPESHDQNYFCFPWLNAEGDFGYPMSVDGTVFRTQEILPLMRSLNYWNPNTFEAALSQNPIQHPYLLSYSKAKLVNIPANRTQNTFQNRHANLEEAQLSKLNASFLEGMKIDLTPFLSLETPSVHFEMNYSLISHVNSI
jgi:hypothetical protein